MRVGSQTSPDVVSFLLCGVADLVALVVLDALGALIAFVVFPIWRAVCSNPKIKVMLVEYRASELSFHLGL